MVGRDRVVRILDGDEVRHGIDARERLLRPPRCARPRTTRSRRRSAGPDASTTCPAVASTAAEDGGALRRQAAVDLAALVGIEVVRAGRGLARRDGVGARGDRLRLERLGLPVRRHLAGDDAEQVALERDDVHDRQAVGGREHAQSPAIAPVADAVERGAGERHRPAAGRGQRDGAGPAAREHGAGRVEQREARGVLAHRDGGGPRDARVALPPSSAAITPAGALARPA